MKKIAVAAIGLLLGCIASLPVQAWTNSAMTGTACRAALGAPDSAISTRENPDPVRRCNRIPETGEEKAIRQKELDEAKRQYDAQRKNLPIGNNSAR